MNSAHTNIVVERLGHVLKIVLDRPEALNALNMPMLQGLNHALDVAAKDDAVHCVWIEGAGDKAFCSGGDVKAARQAVIRMKEGLLSLEDACDFFAVEYALNEKLFHFEKPIIAWMDGITMGGGVGVAGPCRYRLATHKTMWAMPEVTIGFFPDVGAGYYLTRVTGKYGWYLALTGQSVQDPFILKNLGLASHVVLSKSSQEILLRLKDASSIAEIEMVLAAFSLAQDVSDGMGLFEDRRRQIDEWFAHASVADIFACLESDGSTEAQAIADSMRAKSPTSLCVAFEHLNRAVFNNFDEVIARDERLARKFMQDHDFCEGVRAQLVDKDKSPQWKPARIADVSEEFVDTYFQN